MSRNHDGDGIGYNNRPSYTYIGLVRETRTGLLPTPYVLDDSGMRWTVADQAWAVSEGFFVAKSGFINRPVILALVHRKSSIHPAWHYIDYMDPELTMKTIEHHACLQRDGYDKLLKFIEQQDKHGYRGAWDPQVEKYSPKLFWYKNYLAEQADRRALLDAQRKQELKRAKRRLQRQGAPRPVAQGPVSVIARRLFERAEHDKLIQALDARKRAELDALASVPLKPHQSLAEQAERNAPVYTPSIEPPTQEQLASNLKTNSRTVMNHAELNDACAELVAKRLALTRPPTE